METSKIFVHLKAFLCIIFLTNPIFPQVSVHINSNCEVKASEADISISGDWKNSGVYSSQSSRLIFNGATDQYLNQSSDTKIEHLLVNKTIGNLYLTDSLKISDSLSITSGKILTADSALLFLLSSAKSDGGDSVSFVDGPMAKVYAMSASPLSFEYPTGDNLDFRPLTVSFATVISDSITVTAKQINENAQDLSTNYSGLDKVSSVRYWYMDKTGPGTFTDASITLSYDTTATDDGVEIGDELRVAQLDTSAVWVWNSIGGSGSGDYTGTIITSAFSDFGSGYFTFGDATGGGDLSLPVLLTLFELSEHRGAVTLNWKTESEINNQYWLIQRKEQVDSTQNSGVQTTEEFETIAKIDGRGTKSSETTYAFADNGASVGKEYAYRLVDVSLTGRKHYHEEQYILVGLPNKYELFQNYPNPFNPITNIQYDLPVNSDVQINVFNILGQKVATLANQKQKPGYYKIKWNSRNLHGYEAASGMYILSIRASGEICGKKKSFYKVKKMVLVK